MAQLQTILEHHFRHQPPHTLVGSLGDGYLLVHNSIYRNLRKYVAAQNIQFSKDVPTEFVVLPLGQLEHLLTSKKIFYFENVPVLQKVESQAPKIISWDSVSGHLKRNMIFHESCHFFARSIFQKNQTRNKPSVLQIIVEESFANSCELLAIKDAEDNLHKHFYEFNSYVFHPEVKNTIHDLIDQLGFEKVMRWTMLCFMYSNYLYDSIPDKEMPRVLKLAGIDSSVHSLTLKQLKALTKIAFNLNPEFKTATTAFYLSYHGFSKGLAELQKAHFIKDLEQDQQIMEGFISLSRSLS